MSPSNSRRGRAPLEATGSTGPRRNLAAANFFPWENFERAHSPTATGLTLRELDLDTERAAHQHASLAWRFTAACRSRSRKRKQWWSKAIASHSSRRRTANWNAWPISCANIRCPFQLGLAPNEAASPYLAERAYLAGPVASTYLIKGLVRRGVGFSRIAHRVHRIRGSVRFFRSGRAARRHQERS